MLRTPAVIDSTGGASSAARVAERGGMLKVADQAAQLALENGLKVSDAIAGRLLPTPTTASTQRNSRGAVTHPTKPSGVQLEQAIELAQGILPREFESWDEVSASYLPTPNTMEHREIKTPEQIAELKRRSPGGYRNLRETVVNEVITLPTPTARDFKDTNQPRIRDGVKQTDTIALAVYDKLEAGKINWGKYEPAIRRWEAILGRPSPDPTNPDGRDGAHRLSSRFTEWMMGLPEGWITSHGLSRVAELKLAGNGVVPQQAALALAKLMEGINLDD